MSGGQQQFTEGEDYYLNEKGLVTFTEKYHLKRGYCCGSGCRHCPYDYDAVPEPRRSFLIENQTNHRDNAFKKTKGRKDKNGHPFRPQGRKLF